ncbi:hypothetical protein EUGRSUZ_I00156 [Eucalyptus grandis]|uniref:Uncharacterized protein n=2 Tax=Eucalyptus grandis TaxID=71139 RepID=A0ACC3JBV0_EUCGR|nr:hypothetical protein EUGRSUZ_I00156 [Eucalyptus grandis]
MSSSDHDHDNPKLPHDAVVEILKRLPAGSLLRFRGVCRSWRSTIDDPRFVVLHLNHFALDASNRYLVCVERCGPRQSLCSLFSNESLTPPPKWQIEIPFATPSNSYTFVGSCNGLICFKEDSIYCDHWSMYLWNLFTRKRKVIPPSGEERKFLTSIADISHIAVGFGFGARSSDYKIVRIYPRWKNPRVEIYSLGTDSWRSLECEIPHIRGSRLAVFLNGNLHWFASEFVSFDVAGEVFDKMTLPEEICCVFSVGLVSLAVLNDLLAVLISRLGAGGHHSVCSVWVMRDYGMSESWTNLYTFETGECMHLKTASSTSALLMR